MAAGNWANDSGPGMYQDHRRRLRQLLDDGDLALFAGARACLRNGDVEHVFRQDSDLHWLTGCPEPDAVLLLAAGVEGVPESTLFLPSRDPQEELWTGARPGLEESREQAGVVAAAFLDDFEERLASALGGARRLWYRLGGPLDATVLDLLQASSGGARAGRGSVALQDPSPLLHELRLRKDEQELDCMRRAASISAEAHLLAMAQCRPGRGEWEIQAVLEYVFRLRGGSGPAYPPIVAGGANACVLHYIANAGRLREQDMLLVDAGAEFGAYACDLTRTLPVSGRFSGPQRAMYEIVHAAWQAAVAAVEPGAAANAPHEAAVAVLAEGLRDLGVLREPSEEIRERRLYQPWFPHSTSHWLGLDVHDPGAWRQDGKPRPLEAGMVLTIEPGLYFGAADDRVPPELRGCGIRIEDDLAVTGCGAEILTAAAPRAIPDVEAACAAERVAPPDLETPLLQP